MSNIPGISPITPDLEEIRHSDDEAFRDPTAPDDEGDNNNAAPKEDDPEPKTARSVRALASLPQSL